MKAVYNAEMVEIHFGETGTAIVHAWSKAHWTIKIIIVVAVLFGLYINVTHLPGNTTTIANGGVTVGGNVNAPITIQNTPTSQNLSLPCVPTASFVINGGGENQIHGNEGFNFTLNNTASNSISGNLPCHAK